MNKLKNEEDRVKAISYHCTDKRKNDLDELAELYDSTRNEIINHAVTYMLCNHKEVIFHNINKVYDKLK